MKGHIPRLYVDLPLAPGNEISLEEDQAHHLRNVLRIRLQDTVLLFNGQGGEFSAEVIELDKRRLRLRVNGHEAINRESPLRIELAQGIARGERMDFAIQKAVELGVHRIQPLHTEKSQRLPAQRMQKKQLHWRSVARAATEQSGRTCLTEVLAPRSLSEWLNTQNESSPETLRLVLDPAAASGPDKAVQPVQVSLLIGPESGLSDDEIRQAIAQGFKSVRLGPRVLRTETAGLAAVAALQTIWGDYS